LLDHERKKDRPESVALALLAGLTMAQVIAALQTGAASRGLFRHLQAITASGGMAVPTGRIVPGLVSMRAALAGGLFFTLTIGALVSVFAIGWLRLWDAGGLRPAAGRWWLAGIGGAAAAAAFVQGSGGWVMAYLFFVPLAVCLADRRRLPAKNPRIFRVCALWFLLPLIILAGAARPVCHSGIFFDVRDRLLLPTAAGRWVNDFYYRYTLFPAETFKSLGQKQMRTFCFQGRGDKKQIRPVTDILIARDYFPVPADTQPDVTLRLAGTGGRRVIFDRGGRQVTVKLSDLTTYPGKSLRRVSDGLDTGRMMRRFTYISLLAGFPLLVYIIFFSGIRWLAGWMMPGRWACGLSALVCLLGGLAIIWALTAGRPDNLTTRTIPGYLAAEDGRQRVAALKMMEKMRLDPFRFSVDIDFFRHRSMIERYWLARALAHGRAEKAGQVLIGMLEDPSPNVVCMALDSLGTRGNGRVTSRLLDLIKTSNHWYVQWHAYSALRRLGWRQHVSD